MTHILRNPTDCEQLLTRLRKIEGQVRGTATHGRPRRALR
jgi:hypothetical protein